jgi:hypothetical protein
MDLEPGEIDEYEPAVLDNWFTTFSIPLDSDLHSLKDERLFFESFGKFFFSYTNHI